MYLNSVESPGRVRYLDHRYREGQDRIKNGICRPSEIMAVGSVEQTATNIIFFKRADKNSTRAIITESYGLNNYTALNR